MRLTMRLAGARWAMRLALALCTLATWGLGCALVACIAPPPMTAPPQAQAQSFARAILTDIGIFPLARLSRPRPIRRAILQSVHRGLQKFAHGRKPINPHYSPSPAINQVRQRNYLVNVSFGGCLGQGVNRAAVQGITSPWRFPPPRRLVCRKRPHYRPAATASGRSYDRVVRTV